MTKIQALAKFLDYEVYDITPLGTEGARFRDCTRREYLVCTNEEADKACETYILDSIWTFRANFIADHCTGIDCDTIKMIAENGKCESNNAIFLKLIDSNKTFVDDAICETGRGQFLAQYDGVENEVDFEGTKYYIYRTN